MRRSPFLLKYSFELFKKLNWLPLHVEVKVNICIQVHNRINGHSPSYTNDLLVLNSDINDRNSRNSSLNLVCPRFKRETEGDVRTFSGRSARLWNAIPNSLKKIECVLSFKKALIDFFCIFLISFVVTYITFYLQFLNCILLLYFLIVISLYSTSIFNSAYVFNCNC